MPIEAGFGGDILILSADDNPEEIAKRLMLENVEFVLAGSEFGVDLAADPYFNAYGNSHAQPGWLNVYGSLTNSWNRSRSLVHQSVPLQVFGLDRSKMARS